MPPRLVAAWYCLMRGPLLLVPVSVVPISLRAISINRWRSKNVLIAPPSCQYDKIRRRMSVQTLSSKLKRGTPLNEDEAGRVERVLQSYGVA